MHNISDKIGIIISEVAHALKNVSHDEPGKFIENILDAKKIVVCGAGRVGLASKAFAMRLGHLGLNAWFLGDSTVPHIGNDDLLVVASGSGETQTIYDVVERAKGNGCCICLITSNPDSRIGKMADCIIKLDAGSKNETSRKSVQPMTTLNEQSLVILYDSIILLMMDHMGESHTSMWKRHSNLE